MVTLFLIKEARICNGEKTDFDWLEIEKNSKSRRYLREEWESR